MKNFINKIKATVNSVTSAIVNFARKAASSIVSAFSRTKSTVCSTSGEGYVDTGVKIIISVVIGGLILAGLYALFNTTIIPSLGNKISEMFNYAGE